MSISPLNRSFVDKKTKMDKFAAFGGGANELFRIDKDAAPELFALAESFPTAMHKALFMLGGHARQAMRAAAKAGGTNGHAWLGLSALHRSRRMERLKAGEFPRKSYTGQKKKGNGGKWTAPGLIAKSKDRDDNDFFGRVVQTLAFNKPRNKLAVDIGALSASAASFLSAVQEGKRGRKGKFEFSGRQPVTPAIQRALWAAGFPLAADTKYIGQEARPLVPDVFKSMQSEFEPYLVRRITQILYAQGVSWGVSWRAL